MPKLNQPCLKYKILLSGFGLSIFIFTGCGADAVTDHLNRERDRQREAAADLSQDFNRVAGHYQTVSSDSSPYMIQADFQVIHIQKDSFIVPQPVIVGTIDLTPKGLYTAGRKSAEPYPLVFSFVNGNFDSNTQQFAAKISGLNTDGIQISCNVSPARRLKCIWMPSTSSSERFEFLLDPIVSLN